MKIGVCGHLGKNEVFLDGQTIKTKTLVNELKHIYGSKNVFILDTYKWKKNIVFLFFRFVTIIFKCDNIIILPAHNGLKVFVPLFTFFKKIFKFKLHYIVIGGWLPTYLKNNRKMLKKLNEINGIYVETKYMVKELSVLNLKNIIHLPNFKKLKILEKNQLINTNKEVYKLCTFSRVIKEKGIEDAIQIVTNVNNDFNKIVYSLDIYGQIDVDYQNEFNKLLNDCPDYISYKGLIDYSDTVVVLKNYFALLFLTQYKTEGIPGTIIDAYAAGLPIISYNWNSASEIIEQCKTGFIFEMGESKNIEDFLITLYNEPEIINSIKINCLEKSNLYKPEVVIKELSKYLI